MKEADETTTQAIYLGATVCSQLKNVYFPKTPWVYCYSKVGDKFNELKKIMRNIYPSKTDVAIFMELRQYEKQDISDVMGDSPNDA